MDLQEEFVLSFISTCSVTLLLNCSKKGVHDVNVHRSARVEHMLFI